VTPRYEVETPEDNPDSAGAWRPVQVYHGGGITEPLAFESLDETQAYGSSRTLRDGGRPGAADGHIRGMSKRL
jgi:hypothetical protein